MKSIVSGSLILSFLLALFPSAEALAAMAPMGGARRTEGGILPGDHHAGRSGMHMGCRHTDLPYDSAV